MDTQATTDLVTPVRARMVPQAQGPGPTAASLVLRNIVVVCDGTSEGDSALRLADAVACSTSVRVRAVTWLSPEAMRALDVPGTTPIENFLGGVTQQMQRTTEMLGFWRLTLLVGNPQRELARVCREDAASLVIVPGVLCTEDVGPGLALAAGVPVAYVFNLPDGKDYILLSAGADLRSQHLARAAAAAMTALRPRVRVMLGRENYPTFPVCPQVPP
jgi:hypothetical protein